VDAAEGMSTSLTVSTGALETADVVLTLAPQHPAAHGVLRLALTVEGDRVVTADPIVGYMHRGAEKLFEARDYRQILVLANRHDWLSAFGSELGVVLAVERMLGIEVPERAVWIRTLLAELNRVLSHLMFLAGATSGIEPGSPGAAALAGREAVQTVMEEVSGGRIHFMFNQVGGLKDDLPEGWPSRAHETIASVRATAQGRLADLVRGDQAFRAAGTGVAVLAAGDAAAYGVSGPIARASGLDIDLRRDDPYLAYADLPASVMRVVTRSDGDAIARYECLLEQIEVSLDIGEHCLDVLDALPPGPIDVRLPNVVRTPEGDTYAWTENPLGANGYYLVSRGDRAPWRLKLRTASFNNVQALAVALPGTHLGDLTAALASFFYVIGDVDK
jgi:NADH-quinone oxidoreductase subunit D